MKNSNKDDFGWIQPQYTVDKEADPITEPKEFEIEHKKQEETLRRYHSINIKYKLFFNELYLIVIEDSI